MLTFRQLLWRNLLFFRRTNLAVICGVIAATAVISGALIVGDSVRSSLRQISLDRLGQIDFVVQGGRFFRAALAEELQAADPAIRQAAPVLMMPGTLEFQTADGQQRRAGQINVYGGDDRLWSLLEHGDIAAPQPGEMVVNQRVADQLGIKIGDSVSLVVEIPSAIPRDALLGERNQTVADLPVKITGIVPDELGLARLGLNPTQQLPANAYVALSDLQSQMSLQAVARSRRNPFAKPARVNAIFLSTSNGNQRDLASISMSQAETLTKVLGERLQLSDLGLRLVENTEHSYLSLESEQMFLESAVSDAATETAQQLNLDVSPVLVYLVNEMWKASDPNRYSMYSVVAGINAEQSPPFGPFEFNGQHQPLADGGIYLNDWLAEDLQASVGDAVKVKYHVVGDRGELPEEEHEFTVAGIVKLAGPAADAGYTPYVPGVTDAESYADWNEPFPLKKDKITDRDDAYWEDHRTTPKFFVSLPTAQKLWQSRYGNLTTIRLAPKPGQSLAQLRTEFEAALLKQLNPQSLGLAVQPVKLQGLAAASGTTDFTGLFIGFSFFLILSAALLTGLLFRLGVERRLTEIGLLQAIGFTPRKVRRIYLGEGIRLVGLGAILGSVAAVGYAGLMVYGLKTWWVGAIGTRFLFLDIQPVSLLIGGLIAVVVALAAVWWAQRQSQRQSTRGLLSGAIASDSTGRRPWLATLLAIFAGGGSWVLLVAALLGLIPDVEAFGGFSWKIVVFFLIGIGLLTGSLAAFSVALGSDLRWPGTSHRLSSTRQLALRNASRNRSRSVLTASLIASATFVIVAVAAGQMNPIGSTPNPRSGNGGFTLVAETSVPLLYDLNTPTGRAKLGFDPQNAREQQLLNAAKFAPFRMRSGENASCLNLYQTQLPTVLGVPDDVLNMLISENRFLFADTHAEQPWSLLRKELPDGRIPVLGDMNTLMYSLHKGIGQTTLAPNAEQPDFTLEVVGMFANSVLQGVLVMSESNFRKVFPDQVGFRYFLIDIDPAQADELSTVLESRLGDAGFDAEPVSQRLADFLTVQNTYLSTFQTLGGLGLLLGTLGLATVMLRNVLERASEFALLQAIGFQKQQVAGMVAWENALLLGTGLLTGTISALLAMSPHLSSTVSNVPWLSLLAMLTGIFVIGMLAALVALNTAVRLPILSTLRGE
ncbi:ABC transporter permease [Planctomicrobium piriforme]|uniref:ABC-type antimicrobial peptide transport system, permease component n=1 Tax=Planctomicrobium piriforme TaxID=1576369 RepID=A0A1I3PBG3_9PLAN|nr:ABC transporter permease [Planctomicrobium piriforme]SFJ18934.1 ABC-type antimicrobial peptide transport system, permease component [Planctomicrobium piriforme]